LHSPFIQIEVFAIITQPRGSTDFKGKKINTIQVSKKGMNLALIVSLRYIANDAAVTNDSGKRKISVHLLGQFSKHILLPTQNNFS
jgi:hypothetical protein